MTAAPIKTGRDGGMHPTFLAKLKPQEVREVDGTVRYVVDENAEKKLGTYVNPPLETHPVDSESTGTAVASAKGTAPPTKGQSSTYMTAASESKPAPAPSQARALSDGGGGGALSGLWQSAKGWFGSDDKDNKPVSPPAAKAAASTPAAKARPQPAPHRGKAAARREVRA